jgi:hypothetical protein
MQRLYMGERKFVYHSLAAYIITKLTVQLNAYQQEPPPQTSTIEQHQTGRSQQIPSTFLTFRIAFLYSETLDAISCCTAASFIFAQAAKSIPR